MSESARCMSEGDVLLVVNPAAQRGNGAQAGQVAYELLSEHLRPHTVTLATTQRPGHAVDICASTPRQKFPTVIVLGGDGVVHEAVNGFMKLSQPDRPRFGVIFNSIDNQFYASMSDHLFHILLNQTHNQFLNPQIVIHQSLPQPQAYQI